MTYASKSRIKKAGLVLIGLPLVYVAIELVSLLVLTGVNFFRPGTFAASIDEIFAGLDKGDLESYLEGDYHPVLGWDNKPGSETTDKNCVGQPWTESFDADGARSTPRQFATTLIASYGDSYVKGGEVNNDQTWQYQLANQLDQGVKNYAVGAYCTYQAFRKAKLHISQGRVYPITILGINEQNVRRVVNLFRPFLYKTGSAPFAFKPGLGCDNERCIEIENLLKSDTQSMEKVYDLAREARKWDYWAQHKPVFEYPWSLNLWKLVRLAIAHAMESEREPLWHAPEGVAAMRLIVSEFRDTVQEAGSQPVILFIPHGADDG
jgi:hypothetical protein